MLIKALSNGEHRDTVVTRASTYDNPHLPQHIKDALEERYQHTQLGRQELMGLVIDEDENALWTNAMIDAARIDPQDMPPMIRKTVGVDPSGGAGEQGIVVAGKSGLWTPDAGGKPRHHGFVLADYTCRLSPDGWGRRAVQAAIDHEADDITVEINYGRDMAVSTIRAAADNLGIQIPIHVVTATRGKRVRAEPVSALTEQKRWHHAGNFDALEMQLTTWYPELDWSPDRLDAMVWDAVALKLAHLGSGPAQLVVRKGPRPGARALG
jgi:phage terminase large subunit-like protein